jgi:hypothetical protein
MPLQQPLQRSSEWSSGDPHSLLLPPLTVGHAVAQGHRVRLQQPRRWPLPLPVQPAGSGAHHQRDALLLLQPPGHEDQHQRQGRSSGGPAQAGLRPGRGLPGDQRGAQLHLPAGGAPVTAAAGPLALVQSVQLLQPAELRGGVLRGSSEHISCFWWCGHSNARSCGWLGGC